MGGLLLMQRLHTAPSAHHDALFAGPKAVLDRTRLDLGTVRQGAIVKASFPVRNVGARRLILRDRSESCCGKSETPHDVIVGPGESKELVVEIDTTQWQGRMRHEARFESNDPQMPKLTLSVSALVESSSLADQASHEFAY